MESGIRVVEVVVMGGFVRGEAGGDGDSANHEVEEEEEDGWG